MAGAMNIVIEGYEDVVNQLNSMKKESAKVINRTIGDFKSRGPGWVSQEVVKEYNIKKRDVNETKKGVKNAGKIRVGGVKLDNLEIIYQGRLLTPTHFDMRPKRRLEWYEVYGKYDSMAEANLITVKIKKKGPRKALGNNVFLGKSGREGTVQIPFQRVGRRRLPIKAIKTLSVPQMITNETVSENIHKRINEELAKRLDHNLKRILGK